MSLNAEYEAIRSEAALLAGDLTDLAQRATVYHHIFHESGSNHCFPLIAAHGALWAGGYFRFGLGLGKLLSWQYGLQPAYRAEQLAALDEFADTFRDINRRVCIDTYTNFHFVLRYRHHPALENHIPSTLLHCLKLVVDAKRRRRPLSPKEREYVFVTHFLYEQEFVVGPTIHEAVAKLEWPLVKAIALRPLIRFAYFPRGTYMFFRNFADRQERIQNGLRAFKTGAQIGWDNVEARLQDYQILPQALFDSPSQNFAQLRLRIAG